jgi:hypothetical protein
VKRGVALVALSLALATAVGPSLAQGRSVRLDGLVQWIASDKLVMILDTGPSIAVDLGQVPQDQYRALNPRDRIVVIGTVSADNRRVLATSIVRAEWGGQAP